MRWVTPLVYERHRPGRRKPEQTCTCDAVPWPHRAGTVEGCYGLAYCEHGRPTREHPDGGEYCPECAWWEYVDHVTDLCRGT
jgi:hypothetical protein